MMRSQGKLWSTTAGLILTSIILSLLLFCNKGNPVNNNHFNADLEYGTMTDIDGNVYKTIKIGRQEWMAENLRTTKYNDGTIIEYVPDDAEWGNLKTGAYCFFSNSTNTMFRAKYGALYNWYAVKSLKLAPTGWHVPVLAEYKQLFKYLQVNGYNCDGSTDTTFWNTNYNGDIPWNMLAKSLAANSDWRKSSFFGAPGNDLPSNNKSGFSALPSGYRNNGGSYFGLSTQGFWWFATSPYSVDARCFELLSDSCFVSAAGVSIFLQVFGFSVRLVRN